MKKIILLVTTLMLCGCSVEYNVNIGNSIEETIIVDNIVSVETPAFINDQGSSETNEKIEGINYYELEINQDKSIYKYTFGFNNYSQSTAVNYCLKSVKLTRANNSYILNTSNHFTCMDYYTKLENIKINITVKDIYEVTNHNADSVTNNNNIYTWNVNRNNYKNKNLQLIFSNKEDLDDAQTPGGSEGPGQTKKEEEPTSFLFVFMVLISFVALLSVLIIYKNKKNQRG